MATPDGDAEAHQEEEVRDSARAISPTRVCNLDFAELVGADLDWNESISDLNRAACWWKNHLYKKMRTDYSWFAREKVSKVFYATSKERDEYLHEMKEFLKATVALSCIHTTRLLREKTGVGLREEEKGCNDLPPHFTKRKLYELWVWVEGWRVTSNNTGAYPALKDYTKRTDDD
jgi:hypothetical protein